MRALPLLAAAFLWLLSAPVSACTVFKLAGEGRVLVGNNEDGADPSSRLFVAPGEDGRYGAVFFGFDDGFRQGGVNEKGLCYDITATPKMALIEVEGRAEPERNLLDEALATCSTVEEVIALFESHQRRGFERAQLLFVDSSGASAVIDANHVLRDDGRVQLITNFYRSAPELGRHPCRRYEIAESMLAAAEPTVRAVREILGAVHQEGRSLTQYSCIYELREGRIHLYRFHDFSLDRELDVAELLDGGAREIPLDELFDAPNHALERYRAKREGSLAATFRKVLAEEGIEAAVEHYHATKIQHAEILNQLADIGFGLQGEQRYHEAAEAFQLMTLDYPGFGKGFEWLGTARAMAGEYEAAAESYERCLELDPENATAKDVLAQIRAGS